MMDLTMQEFGNRSLRKNIYPNTSPGIKNMKIFRVSVWDLGLILVPYEN